MKVSFWEKKYESVLNDSWFDNISIGFESEFLFPIPKRIDLDYSFLYVAEKMADYFDTSISYCERYHSYSNRKFDQNGIQCLSHIETDTSVKDVKTDMLYSHYEATIRNDSTYELRPIEMVSHVFSERKGLADFFNYLESFFVFLSQSKAITNETCGFHFTVSGLPFDEVSWYRYHYLTGTNSILKDYGRHNNEYAIASLNKVQLNSPHSSLKDGDYSKFFSSLQESIPAGKYQVVHEKSIFNQETRKYISAIEFRPIGNLWYHLKFDKVRATILRMLWNLKKASEPMKKENLRREMRKSFFERDDFDLFFHNNGKNEILFSDIKLDRKSLDKFFQKYLTDLRSEEVLNIKFFYSKEDTKRFYKNLKKAVNGNESLLSNFSEIPFLLKDLKSFLEEDVYVNKDLPYYSARFQELPIHKLNAIDVFSVRDSCFYLKSSRNKRQNRDKEHFRRFLFLKHPRRSFVHESVEKMKFILKSLPLYLKIYNKTERFCRYQENLAINQVLVKLVSALSDRSRILKDNLYFRGLNFFFTDVLENGDLLQHVKDKRNVQQLLDFVQDDFHFLKTDAQIQKIRHKILSAVK